MVYNILFINPFLDNLARWDVPNIVDPPFGICWLAAILEREGYGVKIIDNDISHFTKDQLKKEIDSFKPGIIGLPVITIKVDVIKDYVNFFKKEFPTINIVLGGNHVNSMQEELFKIINADFLMVGEAFLTILELVQKIEKGSTNFLSINGLIWKDKKLNVIKNKEREELNDLDILPLPARHLLYGFPDKYQPDTRYLRKPRTGIITTFGCPYRCIFCDHRKNVRSFSPEYVVNEILDLKEKFGIREIHFWDDNFTLNAQRIREICGELIEGDIDITWSCNGRIDILSKHKEIIPLMKKAGCWYISFGIESGNQKVRDFIKKDLTEEQIKTVIKKVSEAGIFVRAYFMLGHLVDTKETITETIKFARSLPLNSVQFSFNVPLPGTEQFDLIDKYGSMDKENYKNMSGHSMEPVFVPNGLTKEYLLSIQKKAYRSFYSNPKLYFRNIKHVFRNYDSIKKYLFKLFVFLKGHY